MPETNWDKLDDIEFFGFTVAGVRSVFTKELIQLFRDPYLLAFIILLPFAQLLVTGLAVERDLTHIPTIVCNHDKRNASVELLKDFEQSRLFDLVEDEDNEAALIDKIKKG